MFGTITHPHNDYLRLFHDYGFAGLGLFCVGYFYMIVRTFRSALRSSEPMHWSAALGLAAVAIAAITDNVLIYPYAMIPLGVVVGASLALPLASTAAELSPPELPVNEARGGVPSLLVKRLSDFFPSRRSDI